MSEDTRSTTQALVSLPDGKLQVHLIGFMGSGKTTVGQLLARRLLWNFLDLDALVVRYAGKEISAIFADQGEEGFRGAEQHVLRQVVQKPHSVVALGGGTFVDPTNREISKRAAASVWLRCSLQAIRARLPAAERRRRPLWRDPSELRTLYDDRQRAYTGADHAVNAEGSPEACVDAVLAALKLPGWANRS